MNTQLPLSYRWFRASGVTRLVPWRFKEDDQYQKVNERFTKEHGGGRQVHTFAHRQDCDDFAGFQIVGGQITDQVIYYHPSFQGDGINPGILTGTYPDLWTFLREVVIPDTADWCNEEDFEFFLPRKT